MIMMTSRSNSKAALQRAGMLAVAVFSLGLSACNGSSQQALTQDESSQTRSDEQGAGPTTAMQWGDPETKGIRPGINMTTDGASCTTSFVFTDGQGRYFLSTASHCVASDDGQNEFGCRITNSDVSSTVSTLDLYDPANPNTSLISPATVDVPVAYSSWHAMQDLGETSPGICAGNDFALLEIPPEQLDQLHPASLHFRAPTGIASLQDGLLTSGETIWGFGASILKNGVRELHPKQGFILQTDNDDWSYTVYLATPGIPGDSGGHIMTADGKALGIASTLIIAPVTGGNNYSNIAKLVEYAEMYMGSNLEIVTWDDFNASLLP